MIEKEYLTVNDLSKHHKTTARNIRRIITNLNERKNGYMIHKDKMERWQVHHLLIKEFKPQRRRDSKYYALTIRPPYAYSKDVLISMMKMVFDKCEDEELEFNYTIEAGKFNSEYHHIHCYIKTKRKQELNHQIREVFYKIDMKQNKVYDLERWKRYITKDGSPIIKLKK
ncbi:hypothetical protein [Yeosuana marina]|uniref:hypothetical protein n=1 Tax=Yeosuana marina TaxID=1565536 RepID=UPI0030ED4AFF|tara:strand:+ start:708 stop:1217 length:510 start_codon:yes stop_codon:yes gene_type:complete